jgi:hypothetical protein
MMGAMQMRKHGTRDTVSAPTRPEADYTPPSTLPHQMLKHGVMWMDDDYGPGYNVRVLDITPDPAKAELISSRLGPHSYEAYSARKDFHAPALDVDIPAFLLPSTTPGHHHLYLDVALTWGQYKRLLKALARAGVIEKDWARASIRGRQTLLKPPWRLGATKSRGHEAAHQHIETSHVMVREQSVRYSHGYDVHYADELVAVTDRTHAQFVTSTLTNGTTRGPERHAPTLDIDIPATLVPSSTRGHSHLYLDVQMNWTAYKRLLKALARAGVIEKEWAQASIKTGYTSLRPPWKVKPATTAS